MSPDLERRLRDGGKALAGPAAPVTARARETALAAVSRRRGGGGRVLAIGGTVLAAVAVGVVIGSFAFAERGTASEAPGLGFLPAEGWTVLQSGTPATPERPGVALAANVPLHPQDTVDGFPYSTLRLLPPHGVVLVASFMRVGDRQAASEQLPLSLREAVPYIRYGGEVRPKRPLGQYELRAMVAGYAVEVQAYFGTREPASAVLADAQGQLDRLVVSPESEPPAGGTPRATARGEAVSLAFQRYWYPPGNYFTMRFFGTISSGQANEYVAVLQEGVRGVVLHRDCRRAHAAGWDLGGRARSSARRRRVPRALERRDLGAGHLQAAARASVRESRAGEVPGERLVVPAARRQAEHEWRAYRPPAARAGAVEAVAHGEAQGLAREVRLLR